MMQEILKQFAGSSGASDVVQSLARQGFSASEAEGAVQATVEGAAAQLGGGGGAMGMLGGLLGGGGGGGAMGMLGGLMGGGGGGAMGMLGGLVGGGAPASSGLPPELMATIARFVAEKTGLAPEKAQLAVSLVVPRVIDFLKSKT
jgi:hypothetical protein